MERETKKRITDHGEVFTADKEVNAMLDLVKEESYKIDSRFLEPACGTGNFLIRILERKLKTIKESYECFRELFEYHAFIAVSNCYGVDIQLDNVEVCRDRLLDTFSRVYKELYGSKKGNQIKKHIEYVLRKNIIHGNTLINEDLEGNPLVLIDWVPVKRRGLKRVKKVELVITLKKFYFKELVESDNPKPYEVKRFVNFNLGKD